MLKPGCFIRSSQEWEECNVPSCGIYPNRSFEKMILLRSKGDLFTPLGVRRPLTAFSNKNDQILISKILKGRKLEIVVDFMPYVLVKPLLWG